jgi:hypothetical protein
MVLDSIEIRDPELRKDVWIYLLNFVKTVNMTVTIPVVTRSDADSRGSAEVIACREILTDIASTQLPPEISSRIDALEQAAWLEIGIDLKTQQYGKQNGQARTRTSAENARDRKTRAAHMAPRNERRRTAEEA